VELVRDAWDSRSDIQRAWAFFPCMVTVQGREGRRHFSRGAFRLGSGRGAGRCCDLDTNLLAHALCFGSLNRSSSCITLHHSGYNLAKSNGWKIVILFVGLSRGGCDLAPSFKPFAAHAWNRAALYSKVKIGETAILGAGSWGTALAWLWGKDGRQISLWDHDIDRAVRMRETRENSDYLPGLKLPGSVRVTSELNDCAEADLIVFATPSTALRKVAARLRETIGSVPAALLSCVKGIEHGTGMRMSQILGELFPEQKIAVLSGPNLAAEVVQNLPTATVIGCNDAECATSLQGILGSPRFRVYTSQEVTSIELGGALKNVFAVAAGISDGLGLGDNSKAALVTRSLAELVRLGVAMGGTVQAFYGLSGAGDLIVTCYSERSRNHTVGKRLGRGESFTQITQSMKMVAEGIPTARSAFECARQLKIETPIIDQVYAVLYEQKKPTVALEEVLNREQKAEQLQRLE
jgi:glycerol-3-phosphate dehydrogenase (NAD(P)+)